MKYRKKAELVRGFNAMIDAADKYDCLKSYSG
jgi:hypothetical protein